MLAAVGVFSLPDMEQVVFHIIDPSFKCTPEFLASVRLLEPTGEFAAEPWGRYSIVYGSMDKTAVVLVGSAPYGECALSDTIMLLFNNIKQLVKNAALVRDVVLDHVVPLSEMIDLMFADGCLGLRDFKTLKAMIKGRT